jgi:aspartyl protease family protein
MRLVLILLAIVGLALLIFGGSGSILGLGTGAVLSILASLALIIWLGGWLVHAYQGRLPRALRDLAIWAGLALVLVAVYSFREEFAYVGRRVAGELLPPGEGVIVDSGRPGEAAVRIRRRGDGHFVARVEIDGAGVSMLVDTGASAVVLSPTDARRIGINVDGLTYTVPVNTANGSTYAAAVRLRRVAIGPISIGSVDALVARPGALNESLLGMTFLRRLKSYEFSGDFLTLRG